LELLTDFRTAVVSLVALMTVAAVGEVIAVGGADSDIYIIPRKKF
jgi:hypothetical protein